MSSSSGRNTNYSESSSWKNGTPWGNTKPSSWHSPTTHDLGEQMETLTVTEAPEMTSPDGFKYTITKGNWNSNSTWGRHIQPRPTYESLEAERHTEWAERVVGTGLQAGWVRVFRKNHAVGVWVQLPQTPEEAKANPTYSFQADYW
jgi:hypothetical protein